MKNREGMIALMIKGAISELPDDQQARIREAVKKPNAVIEEYGDDGLAALALLGSNLEQEET